MHLLKPSNTRSTTDYGRGYGYGYGNGYGFGYGCGDGDGYGCGLGDGYGCGYGYDCGDGNGMGGSTFTQDTNALLILLAVQKHVEETKWH